MLRLVVIVQLLTFPAVIALANTQKPGSEPSAVSLVQLIATPERFHNKAIRVIGFCWLEFEGNALHLHREDFDQAIAMNAVWLDLGWPVPDKYMALKGKYVIVEGTFSSSDRGHFGMFAGSIKSINRLEEWRGRVDPTPPKRPK
jgi:hypothetical protein